MKPQNDWVVRAPGAGERADVVGEQLRRHRGDRVRPHRHVHAVGREVAAGDLDTRGAITTAITAGATAGVVVAALARGLLETVEHGHQDVEVVDDSVGVAEQGAHDAAAAAVGHRPHEVAALLLGEPLVDVGVAAAGSRASAGSSARGCRAWRRCHRLRRVHRQLRRPHPTSVIRGSSSGRGTIRFPPCRRSQVGGHDNVVPRGVLALQQRVQLTEPDVPGRSSVMVVPLMMVPVCVRSCEGHPAQGGRMVPARGGRGVARAGRAERGEPRWLDRCETAVARPAGSSNPDGGLT